MLTVYIDTREQKLLDFTPYASITQTKRCGLPYGDYAAKCGDIKIPYVFERKSKEDLWGTLGGNPEAHRRFKNELERAREAGCKICLIIECSIMSIFKGHKCYLYEAVLDKNGKRQYETVKGKKRVKKARSKEKKHHPFGGLAMYRKLLTFKWKYKLNFICCKNREEMAFHIAEEFRTLGMRLK